MNLNGDYARIPERILSVRTAMVRGKSDDDIHQLSKIDPWFLAKLRRIVDAEATLLHNHELKQLSSETLLELKQLGFSDRQIAWGTGTNELQGRRHRHALGIRPVYKTVDTVSGLLFTITVVMPLSCAENEAWQQQ